MKGSVVMVSGGFDPVHVGHVRMLKEAQRMGAVIVALNSDDWLLRKKGFVFMPWVERAEILRAMGMRVVPVKDDDGTVVEALIRYEPDIFANGGDRLTANEQEHAACEELKIKEVFKVGGRKIQSSSRLARQVNHHEFDADPR